MRKRLLSLLSTLLCMVTLIQAQNNCCVGENLGGACLGEENCESFVPYVCDTLNNRCFQKWWTWPGTSITAEDYVPANLSSSRRYEGSRSLHMRPDANGARPDVVKDLFDLSSGIHRLSWKMYVPSGKTGYFNIQHDFKRLMRGQPNWAYQVFFTPDGSVQVRVGAEGTFRVSSFKPDCWLKVTQVINLDRDSVHFFLNNRLVARWKFSYGVVDLDNDGRGDQKFVDRKLGAIDFYADNGFEYYIDKICYQQAPVFSGGNCPAQGLGTYCLGGVVPYTPTNACGLPAYDGYVEGEEAFPGACNPGVSACADAIPLACGQTLSNQSNGGIGAKNTFTSKDFSSCISTQNAYGGNDKVYRIVITEPTNLQATLNILDAGRNLDMFLMSSCLTYPFANTSQPECVYCIASSTNNNLSNPEESFSTFLEPGTYYLVVDAPQAGTSVRFNLSLSCGCSCVEGGDTPLGPNVLCENFDVYNPGALVAQSPRWKLWDATSHDAIVEASTEGSGKVLRIQRTSTLAPDVVFPLGNRTTGRYRLSFNLFVVKGASGYYNVQHTDGGGTNPNWAFQVEFQSNGFGRLFITSNRVIGAFYYKNGEWNKIVQIIDLDKDRAELWINNQMVHSWRFSVSNTVELKQLGALNFYANTGNNILLDNICMFAKESTCTDATLNPVCLSDGRSYRNETQARCDLYTSAELGACVSVCDLGGTMIYRGDRFSGTLAVTDQAPNLSWQDSCVTATFAQAGLDSLFSHGYIFYNDEANPFNIDLTASNGARAFIYRCSQDGISSNTARFRCIGRDGETFSQKGYYYVLIMGPRSNSTYAFSVLPEASCRLNPTEIACNVPFANTLSNPSRYGIGSGGTNVYQSCYQGGRTYAGSDREFSFRLTKASKVSISIQGQAGLGVFVYDFLCGKNCLNFAETNDLGALARTDTMMLNPGVYYLIVDQAISGSNGAFTLTVNCTDYNQTAFLQEVGAPNCAVNASGRHNVILRSLRNTRVNGQRLNTNDRLHFFYPKNNRGDLLASSVNWNGSELQVSLPQDATGDTLKCGYANNDLLKIKLTRNNVVYDLTPQVQPIDGSTVTAGNRFASNGTSLITELNSCCTPHNLKVSPSQRELTGQGGIAEFRVASNMSWTARIKGNSSWLKVSNENGFANDVLRVEVDPNNSNADRRDTVYLVSPSNEVQKVVITQSRSSCAAVAVNLGPDRQICRGEALNLTATGTGTFLWSTGQSGSAINVRPQVNASYAVTITQNGCSGVDEVNVTVNETPVIDLGPDLQLCSGDNIVFVATGGDSYRWSNGATTATVSVRPIQNSTYAVTVTKNGCAGTDEVVVSLEEAPQVNVTPNQSICSGKSVSLVAAGGNSYLWNNGRTSSTISVSPTTTTSYTVTVTNGNCSAIGRTTVNVTPGPTLNTSIDLTICAGESPTIAASGTAPFRWSTGATTSSIVVSPVQTTTYSVSVSANGCEASDDVTITVLPKPNINAGADQTICAGQVANLAASGSGGNYRWSNGATTASIQVQPNTLSEYTVSVTKDGCTSSDKVIVDVNASPAANAGPDKTITCEATQVRLDGSKSASGVLIRYQWTELDDGRIISGNTTASPVVNRPGNYSLLVSNIITGCSSTDQVNVSGIEPVEVFSIQLLEVRCYGEATGSATLTLRGGQPPYQYNWSNGGTTNMVRGLKGGTYTVTVSDQSTCRDTLSIEIVQPEPVKVTNIRVIPAPTGNTGGIDISVAGGSPPYDFRWFKGSTLLSATEDLTGIGIGEYIVEVYDANNCSYRSDPILVSKTVGVEDLALAKASRLYPNPTDGKSTLEINLSKAEKITLELYDYLGRRLEQRKLGNGARFMEVFDLSKRAAGLYYVRMVTKDGFAVKELVKE